MTDDLSTSADTLDDEICDSQPISLSPNSSNNENISHKTSPKLIRPAKCTGQRGHFRSIEEIDPKYRHVFSYRYFNYVQSRVIEDALYSDNSMVVCAPTGSGKTVIFEMAIVQLLMDLEDKNNTDDFKIIYMAPVKALCTERLTEWYPKFLKLGHLCIEVTGDTDVEFPQLKPYRIIITTPEKWDMLTRRWKDHRNLVEVVKLFLIDEVHILNDEARGPVLEAVVSRMKTIELSVQSTHRLEKLILKYRGSEPQKNSATESEANSIRIRFVAISATVANPEDVAAWLGTKDRPAVYYKFGDECRPVKLKRIVEGYPCAPGTSIFKFDIILNYKLWNIIQKYHNGKPTLIFCNTRKSVALTAEALSRETTINLSVEQKNKLMAIASNIKNKKIQSLLLCGVGCHHAGLLFEERIVIENAFRKRDLPILITTTTLAMGVNLPAHLVIIKNTQQYVNGAYQEYSISTILQMVGRAGRPQYDTEATAVIMTRSQDKARYHALVEGSEPLQSFLHKRLPENLNSEAALGTVCDVSQCVQWVNSTFLSVRAARDPKRYLGLHQAAPTELIGTKIEELCVRAMNKLATAGLITMDEAYCIESTEAGRLMSIYYLDLETMKLIMKLEGSESLERLLWLICESHELSDMHLRVDERRCLNALNRNNAADTIRFPMKGKIMTRQMKLNCVIQAVLGCLTIPDPSLNQEAMKIMRIADRVCKCLVYYVTRQTLISQNPKFYSTILNAITLAKCIYAHLWENSPYVSRQLKGIGQTFSSALASAGKVKFMLLEESHPRDLERIMNKGPPAGNIIRKQISLLPKYSFKVTTLNARTVRIQLYLLNKAYLAENMEHLTAGVNHKSYIIVGDSENYLLHMTSFTDSDLIHVYDGCITLEVTRKHTIEHKMIVHCISSTFAGIDEQCEFSLKDLSPNQPATIQIPHDVVEIQQSASKDISTYFKQNKRKLTMKCVTEIKEKKKRNTNLIHKFQNLKESFGSTSKETDDIQRSPEISNKPIKISTNDMIDEIDTITLENWDLTLENIFAEDFDDEEVVNDKVTDILNLIDDEMECSKKNVSPSASKQVQTKSNLTSVYKSDKNDIMNDSTRSVSHGVKRKRSGIKSNFKFLDIIEKKINTQNDTECAEAQNETGFTNTIKCQIEQYLQKTHDNPNAKLDIIDIFKHISSSQYSTKTCNEDGDQLVINKFIDSQNTCCKFEHETKKLNTTENHDCITEKKILDFKNKQKIDSLKHLDKSKMIEDSFPVVNATARDIGNNKNSLCKPNNRITTKNIFLNTVTEMNTVSQNPVFLNESKITKEDVEQENVDLMESEHDTESDCFYSGNKNEIISKTSFLQIMPYKSPNDKVKKDVNDDIKLSVPNNDNTITQIQKGKVTEGSNENDLRLSCENLNKMLDKREGAILNRPVLNIKNLSIVKAHLDSRENYFIPLCSLYNISSNKCTRSMENNNLLPHNSNSNSGSIRNFIPNSQRNTENVEFMKRYHMSRVNVVDITTNTSKHKVHIVGQLKVDLDITKIVYKNDKRQDNDDLQIKCGNNESKEANLIPNRPLSYIKDTKNVVDYKDDVQFNKSDGCSNQPDNKYEINSSINLQTTCSNKTPDKTDEECYNRNVDKDVPAEMKSPKDRSVKDILEKYNNILEKTTKNNVNVVTKKIWVNKKSDDTNSFEIKTSRRAHRIKDLDQINVELPPFLTESQRNTSQTIDLTIDNIQRTFDKSNEDKVVESLANENSHVAVSSHIQEDSDINLQTTSYSPVYDIEDIYNPISPKLVELSDFNLEVDLNDAILDPMTLLQRMNNDDDDVIPPPIEFCDTNTYSPASPLTTNFTGYELLDSQDFLEFHEDIIADDSINLTPSKEIETCKLREESLDSTPDRSITVYNNFGEHTSPHFLISRREKFSQFKFKRKNVFRK